MSRFKSSFPIVCVGVLFLICKPQARAGSINNSAATTSAVNCDDRRSHLDMSWCTQAVANELYNKCYAVIHMQPENFKKCDWQGCGPLSLVGQKAKIDGNAVVEYGVSTPYDGASNPPASWQLNSTTKEVLPKSPYLRHYLTLAEFVRERAKCNNSVAVKNAVTEKVCQVNPKAFDMNVYFYCMKNKGKFPSL